MVKAFGSLGSYKDGNGDTIDNATGRLVTSGGSVNSNNIAKQNQQAQQNNTPQYNGNVGQSSNSSSNNDLPNLYNPGSAAKQSSTFNGNNMNDASGVYIGNGNGGYDQASHGQAMGNNPLHAVNAQRQKAIEDAMASNQWQGFDNFSAGQAPAHYSQGADGNFAKNKDYFASYIESKAKTKNAANAGNGSWSESDERDLMQWITDMKTAPGAMPHIATVNSSQQWANEYGLDMADSNWYNSAANNPQVRIDGRYSQNAWQDNAVFQNDPALLEQATMLSNSYGTPEMQAQRQSINDAYSPQGQQSGNFQMQQQMGQQQAEFEEKLAAMEKLLEEQKRANEYAKGEATDANKGSGGNAVVAPPSNGEHIFDSGNGQPGYTQSNNSMNDALYKYLEQQWQGGF